MRAPGLVQMVVTLGTPPFMLTLRHPISPFDNLNLLQKLLKVGSLTGHLMHTIHNQITQLIRIPTVHYITHSPHKKVLVYGQSIQIVTLESLTNSRHLHHRQPHHKHLVR